MGGAEAAFTKSFCNICEHAECIGFDVSKVEPDLGKIKTVILLRADIGLQPEFKLLVTRFCDLLLIICNISVWYGTGLQIEPLLSLRFNKGKFLPVEA